MIDTHDMTKLIRRLSWFAACALLVIAATVSSLYVLQVRTLRDLEQAREYARIARNAAALATDRETSIRGYLLTRDEKSLVRDLVTKTQLPKLLDSLATMAASDRVRVARLRHATDALSRWDREFAEPAESGRLTGAGAPLAGKPLFDVVRARFAAVVIAADARFARSTARVRQIEIAGAAALLGELLIFFGLLIYLIRGRLVAQADDLARQQELLEQQAVELELQVNETESANESLAESLAEIERKDGELRKSLTEARQHEEKLRRSDERYRYVAKATNDVVYEWDIETNSFEWSEGMRDLFGYAAEDVGSSPEWITGLVHPEDEPRISGTFAAAFSSGAHRWQQPYRLRRKDGKYASVEGRAYIIRGDDGAPRKVIGAITDRSPQQSLEEQLRQSQKMDAVGRLAGGVAHDFNNILTVIRMSSEFLLEDLPDASESRHEANEILRASDRAAALTRQLLAFSRHQVLNPRIIVLNDVVDGIQSMVKRVVPENIAVNTELAAQLDPIKADTGQIEQVIVNLVINAADAMPNGGRLDIRTSNVEVDAAFSASHLGVEPGSYVCLTVSDTGHGMDKETVTRIFEPFFTTKPVGKGTGLGLATVHGIVTQSGGKIWVYSEPGHGTTFKIFLPRSEEVARPITPRSARKLRPATETILLVEDEESTREAVERSLTRAGYKVLLASNGVEALEIAGKNGKKIALVLTDSMMPEMGGLELVARLRETRPEIRVLMMSGYTEQTSASRFGISEQPFIEKPFAAADLLAAVQRVLHGEKAAPAA
ncbi:MAG: ATP-binding protein [Gemmatimonadaceae bacterium]